MRILAILAIVAATGFTVGCNKQPSTAETKAPEQEVQESEAIDASTDTSVQDNNLTSQATQVKPVEQGAKTEAPISEPINTVVSAPSEPVTNNKQLAPAPKTTNKQAAPIVATTGLITELLDKQAEKAKISQQELTAKSEQRIQTEAQVVSQQSKSVADVPAVDLDGYTFFGDPSQPGYQIQTEIFTHVAQGLTIEEATLKVVNQIVNDENSIVGGEANRMISLDVPISTQFIGEISRTTNLTDATKLSIETVPGSVENIISLGVVLYPDYAQDIINAAALTGEIADQDALLLAIAAGADPTTVSTATASGPAAGAIAAAPIPLGSGVGAGGAGGGDTTASTN